MTGGATPATIEAPARLAGVGRAVHWVTRSRAATIGGMIVLAYAVMALAAPWAAPMHYAKQDWDNGLIAPVWQGGTWSHPLGTDVLGRDILSRIIYGSRVSLGVGLSTMVLSMAVGVSLGLAAGFFEGALDALIMRVVDMLLALPSILFGIAVMVALGPSIVNVIIVLALTGWVSYARLVRGLTLSLKQQDFVTAAEAIGSSSVRIMARHVLPNTIAQLLVLSTFQVAGIIIAEASLSFLGIGVPPPYPSWGSMLSQGRQYIVTAWWLAAFPGLALTFAVLAINLFGDGLRDRLDPRLRGSNPS